jgi:hypothetical protein
VGWLIVGWLIVGWLIVGLLLGGRPRVAASAGAARGAVERCGG